VTELKCPLMDMSRKIYFKYAFNSRLNKHFVHRIVKVTCFSFIIPQRNPCMCCTFYSQKPLLAFISRAMVCLLYLLFQIKRMHVLLLAALLKHGPSGPCWSVKSSAVLAYTATRRLQLWHQMRSLCLHQLVILDICFNKYMILSSLWRFHPHSLVTFKLRVNQCQNLLQI